LNKVDIEIKRIMKEEAFAPEDSLSSSLFDITDEVTSSQKNKSYKGMEINYGFYPSPFGDYLIASSKSALLAFWYAGKVGHSLALEELEKAWSDATLLSDKGCFKKLAKDIVSGLFEAKSSSPLPLLLKGTPLQLSVWRALLKIPSGKVTSYSHIATLAGKPRAVRAVASAIGNNPIGILIPCHRVLRKSGALGGYRCGLDIKRALLARELGISC
jgi:AraC family transcriptional regulator of adaptative response/methylated-DNA-[protein]-cysteine methyltransferase